MANTTNTTNIGAFNGNIYQLLRGIRTFVNMIGSAKSHANIEFPINTEYSITKDKQYFTEETENEGTVNRTASWSNFKNTFSFMKKGLDISQTALNSSLMISGDNVLNEVGTNYMLTDAFASQFDIKLQEWAREYNDELLNSEYVEFSPSANRTMGAIEASKLYAPTNIDVTGKGGLEFIEELERLMLALLKEGVQGGEQNIGMNANQITGLENQTPINSVLTLLVNPVDRLWIEQTLRNTNNPLFQIERSITKTGTKISLIVTSLGDIEFRMDEDVPQGTGIVARFTEMHPVFQLNNPRGREGANGNIAPAGAIIAMTEKLDNTQGVSVEMFLRVGLDFGAKNRIGSIVGINSAIVKVDPVISAFTVVDTGTAGDGAGSATFSITGNDAENIVTKIDGVIGDSPTLTAGAAGVAQDVTLTVEYEFDGVAQTPLSEPFSFTPESA